MSKEEALRYWEWIYENIKDYFDPHWEGSERREHREYVQAVEWAIKALRGADTKGGNDGTDNRIFHNTDTV